MMLWGFAQTAFITIFLLLALPAPAMAMMQCQLNQAPVINIMPNTKEIQYDFDKSATQLSMLKANTISPYGLGVDQITGGLRHDMPTMETRMKFYTLYDPNTGSICMSYDTINVSIELQPTIYIAREFNKGKCGEEVLEHEKKHVAVDRQIINKYARLMGIAVQDAVNEAGAIGPFAESRLPDIQQMMVDHINSALQSVKLSMQTEMDRLQQQVDTLEEYERVSAFCTDATKQIYKNR